MHLSLEDARLHRNADIDDVLWRPSGLVHAKQIHLWPAQQFSDGTKRVVRERSSNCCGAGSTTHADAHASGSADAGDWAGGDVETARVSVVPVGRTITLAYVLFWNLCRTCIGSYHGPAGNRLRSRRCNGRISCWTW